MKNLLKRGIVFWFTFIPIYILFMILKGVFQNNNILKINMDFLWMTLLLFISLFSISYDFYFVKKKNLKPQKYIFYILGFTSALLGYFILNNSIIKIKSNTLVYILMVLFIIFILNSICYFYYPLLAQFLKGIIDGLHNTNSDDKEK